MMKRLPLLILAGFVAEIASIAWLGSLIGVLPTLLLLLCSSMAGVGLIRSAGSRIGDALRSPVQAAGLRQGVAGEALWRVFAGLFLLIPGFLSDVIALLLFVPPVRRWLRSRIPVTAYSAGAPRNPGGGMVIDAEVVEITAELEQRPPARDPKR